jgi:hypothetical protein
VTAEALLSELRARGVTLEAHGDRLKIRPSTLVTPGEVERLRALKPEILALLVAQRAAPPSRLTLDPTTVREVLGPKPDEHDLGILRLDVLAAVAWLEAEIQTGTIGQHRLLVHGRPLGDWLDLDTIAGLLKLGQRR